MYKYIHAYILKHTEEPCCATHVMYESHEMMSNVTHLNQKGVYHIWMRNGVQHIVGWNTLQHTATHCNTLQRTASHCNTLQHTATHCNTHQEWRAAHSWVSDGTRLYESCCTYERVVSHIRMQNANHSEGMISITWIIHMIYHSYKWGVYEWKMHNISLSVRWESSINRVTCEAYPKYVGESYMNVIQGGEDPSDALSL